MLRIVGGSAAAGATGGAAAEGGGFVSALVAAMRGTITAGKDFSQAQKYIDSIADQLGPTGDAQAEEPASMRDMVAMPAQRKCSMS